MIKDNEVNLYFNGYSTAIMKPKCKIQDYSQTALQRNQLYNSRFHTSLPNSNFSYALSSPL